MDYLRRENESQVDYIIRLVEGKNNGNYDIDYTELFQLAFGAELSSTEARKRYYGVRMLLPYLDSKKLENVSGDEILQELEQKKRELEKEKIRFQDQRREYKKLLTLDSRFENLLDKIDEATLEISQSKPLVVGVPTLNSSEKEGVLLISDWHSELEVDNFLNKFNKEEFLKRVNKLISKTIEHGLKHNISKLHVFNLGDLLSGIIHNSVRVANNELTVTQTMFVAELLSEMLCKFASNFNSVVFYQVLDNHSRVFASKEESIVGESFARFIPWYLKPRLKDFDNIEINTDALDGEIMVTDICDKKIFAVHGHCDKLNSVVGDLALMIKQIPDYIFVSHWHHNIEDEIHSCEVVVNQSLIGSDDYGKAIRKTSKPAQKFMIFNKEDGRECTYSIKLN